MIVNATVTRATCPNCQSSLVAVEHEAPWCATCEWNLDHFEPIPWVPLPWRLFARLDHRWGYGLDARLIGRLAAESEANRRTGFGEWALRVISAMLFVVLLTLTGLAVWLVARFQNFPAVFGAAVLLAIVFGLRPRVGRLRRLLPGPFRLTEQSQPALFELLRQVSAASGTRMPEHVLLNFEFNATTAVVGLRRQRVLVIGLPLWIALRPQERVALLAHEFGHFANEDSKRAVLVQPALKTFGSLAGAFYPKIRIDEHPNLFFLIFYFVAGILSWSFWLAHVGLNMLGAKHDRRRELRADRLAARVAGSAAASGTMDVLAGAQTMRPMCNASAKPGDALTTWLASMDFARERLNEKVGTLRQLTKRTDASLFATHPAAGYRHAFLAGLPHQDPQVVVTETLRERLDAEINPYAEALLKHLRHEHDGWSR